MKNERKCARTITRHDLEIGAERGGVLSIRHKETIHTDDWISLNADEQAKLKEGDPVFVIPYSGTLFDCTFCGWLLADRPSHGERKVAQIKVSHIAWKKTWPPERLVRRTTLDERACSPKVAEGSIGRRDPNRRGP